MAPRYVYTLELTREEYRSASVMSARGYLGEIVTHATTEDWSDDDATVTLRFTEPDAWKVMETCEADPHAVWSLTTPSTTLGAKFLQFVNAIV